MPIKTPAELWKALTRRLALEEITRAEERARSAEERARSAESRLVRVRKVARRDLVEAKSKVFDLKPTEEGVVFAEHTFRGGTVMHRALSSRSLRFPTVGLTVRLDVDRNELWVIPDKGKELAFSFRAGPEAIRAGSFGPSYVRRDTLPVD